MKYKIKRISTFKWGPEIDGKRYYEIDGGKITVTAGLDKAGNYITGLSEADERKFEALFGKKTLVGYYNNHSNFWCGGELFGSIVEPWSYTHITDTGSDGYDKGVILDTSIPEEEFKVLVLLAQKQVNTKDRKSSDAKLEIESLEDKIDEIVEFRSLKTKAYALFDSLNEESKRKYYTMLEGKSSKNQVIKTIDFTLTNYIESPTKVKRFISLLTDKSIDEKYKYQQLVDAEVIEVAGNKYFFDGKELGKTIHDVYTFLNEPKNSTLRASLMKQYLASFEQVA
jgi:hypothetical protein